MKRFMLLLIISSTSALAMEPKSQEEICDEIRKISIAHPHFLRDIEITAHPLSIFNTIEEPEEKTAKRTAFFFEKAPEKNFRELVESHQRLLQLSKLCLQLASRQEMSLLLERDTYKRTADSKGPIANAVVHGKLPLSKNEKASLEIAGHTIVLHNDHIEVDGQTFPLANTSKK